MNTQNQVFLTFTTLLVLFFSCCTPEDTQSSKPRIIISTDIGGTDPDDFQSIIHYFMYANEFQIEGLISSPYGPGRKEHLLEMIDLYEKDLPKLDANSKGFPSANFLRELTKQGAIREAPFAGYRQPTEGSEWIIQCAKKESDQPLWILVWGGFEDLAQALHDAPEIKNNIRVYLIGGPNKKWGVNSYAYIVQNHPELWMIEANATYRGWFLDEESPVELKNYNFYNNYITKTSNLGADFVNHYGGSIKMGDTPSLMYVYNGDPNNPYGESWGGAFEKISYSDRDIFDRNTTIEDTVATYGVIEWYFKGPEIDIPSDSHCFTLTISEQDWPGYYLGGGNYAVRYSSKKPETCSYTMTSKIIDFPEQSGEFVSVIPWPGKRTSDDYQLGDNWYSDSSKPEDFIGVQQGAKTVAKHRQAFLMDWVGRWKWLE